MFCSLSIWAAFGIGAIFLLQSIPIKGPLIPSEGYKRFPRWPSSSPSLIFFALSPLRQRHFGCSCFSWAWQLAEMPPPRSRVRRHLHHDVQDELEWPRTSTSLAGCLQPLLLAPFFLMVASLTREGVAIAGIGHPVLSGLAVVFPAIFMTTMVSLSISQGHAVPAGAIGPMVVPCCAGANLSDAWLVGSTNIFAGRRSSFRLDASGFVFQLCWLIWEAAYITASWFFAVGFVSVPTYVGLKWYRGRSKPVAPQSESEHIVGYSLPS